MKKAPAFLIALALVACSDEPEMTDGDMTPPEVEAAIDDADVPSMEEASAEAEESITEDNMDAEMDALEKEIMSDN